MLTNWKQARFKVKLVPHCCSQHVSKCTNFTLKGNYPCFLFQLHFSQFWEQLGCVCRHVRHFNSNYDRTNMLATTAMTKPCFLYQFFASWGKYILATGGCQEVTDWSLILYLPEYLLDLLLCQLLLKACYQWSSKYCNPKSEERWEDRQFLFALTWRNLQYLSIIPLGKSVSEC